MGTPASIRCHLRPTPNRCVLSLLVGEALLWLSDRLGWAAWWKGCAGDAPQETETGAAAGAEQTSSDCICPCLG